MIISHRLKFAFFRVPKTGSSTASFVLKDCNIFDKNDLTSYAKTEEQRKLNYGWHTTPLQAITFNLITFEQLLEYNCFAFFRNPKDRFYSARNHGLSIKEMQKQLDFFFIKNKQIVTILNYNDYDNELRKMLKVLNCTYGEIPKLNVRERIFTPENFWTNDRIDCFNKEFSEDINFYNKYCEKL